MQRWLKSVGDAVAENEPLIELETDKVTIEIPAPAGGVLREILKQEQEEIAPGELLGRIQAGAESQHGRRRPRLCRQATHAPAIDDADDRGAVARMPLHCPAVATVRRCDDCWRSTGCDASEVRGSGAGGRITVDDVLEHVAQEAADRRRRACASNRQRRSQPDRVDACRIQRCASASPSAWSRACCTRRRTSRRSSKLDLSAVLAHRAQHRADFEQRGASLTLTAYFLAACVDAIREVPEANSRWTDDALEIFDNIDIGVGTAVEGKGLVVPVVRARRSRWICSASRARWRIWSHERAKTSSRRPTCAAARSRSPITASAAAWSRRPSSSISRSRRFSVSASWRSARSWSTTTATDRIVVRPRCYVTLTLDHRVMDGHRANRFLQVLVRAAGELAATRLFCGSPPKRAKTSAAGAGSAPFERLHARRQKFLRSAEYLRVEIAAQRVRVGAGPLPRQQRGRQLRIAQVNLAIFVHEQRAQHERGFAGRLRRASQRVVERCEHLDEASIASRQIAEVPAHRDQLLVRRVRDDGAAESR